MIKRERKIHARDLPNLLTPDVIADLGDIAQRDNPSGIVLRADRMPTGGPLAESRLLGLFALLRWKRIPLTLSFPTLVSSSELHNYLTETVAGVLLTSGASRVLDGAGDDIRPRIRERHRSISSTHNGIIGEQDAFVLLDSQIAGDEAPMTVSPILFEEDPGAFEVRLGSILDNTLGAGLSQRLRGFDWIAKYAFEIVQNTRDHGMADLRGRTSDCRRAIILRRHRAESETFGRGDPALRSHLEALNNIGLPPREMLEISIADESVGIPARMEGNMEVYEQSPDEQRLLLEKALAVGGTSKRRAIGSGLGLPTAMKAVERAYGLIVVRTGQLDVFRHYLGDLSPQHTPDTNDLRIFEIAEPRRSFALGTSVSLVVPTF